jgi:hypothetical protein
LVDLYTASFSIAPVPHTRRPSIHFALPYMFLKVSALKYLHQNVNFCELVIYIMGVDFTSEKDSTCISPFVHPNVHVITCSSSMWPEMHASAEEFTWFLYARMPLVIASHNLFPRGQKDALTLLLIHAN